MSLVPAIPPEDYSRYFTVKELALIVEKRKIVSLREALRRWANDPKARLRLYYRPAHNIFHPDPCFHIEDVLTLGTQSGYLRVTEEFVQETVAAREAAVPSVEVPTWTAAPLQISRT